jgi:hypothetical protein
VEVRIGEVNGTGKCGTAKASYSYGVPDVEARDRSVGRLHPSNLDRMRRSDFLPLTDEFHAEQKKSKNKSINKRKGKCKSETIRAHFSFISS